MIKYLLIVFIFGLNASVYAVIAGGRPNAFSEGNNGLAGVVNPANAVWIDDRIDIGAFYVRQKSSLNNRDHNPFFPSGKIDYTYRSRNIFTFDGALHKQLELKLGSRVYDTSVSLAFYTMPTVIKLRTKMPIPLAGTTPALLQSKPKLFLEFFP